MLRVAKFTYAGCNMAQGFLLFAFWSIFLAGRASAQAVVLPNEECLPRKSLVVVDNMYQYYPLMISLHTCSGVCGEDSPFFRKCVSAKSKVVPVSVYNKFTLQNETANFYNDTDCQCVCAHNASVCNPDTQKWDSQTCHCECRTDIPFTCPDHYKWDPGSCSCACDRVCIKKMELNESDCSCNCKPYFYRKCAEKQQILNETDCRCISPQRLLGNDDCRVLPSKWAALIITISFAAFFVFAFDCILLTRNTGCMYSLFGMVSKMRRKDDSLHVAIKKANSKETMQSTI